MGRFLGILAFATFMFYGAVSNASNLVCGGQFVNEGESAEKLVNCVNPVYEGNNIFKSNGYTYVVRVQDGIIRGIQESLQ